jgi:hypothetical protein
MGPPRPLATCLAMNSSSVIAHEGGFGRALYLILSMKGIDSEQLWLCLVEDERMIMNVDTN